MKWFKNDDGHWFNGDFVEQMFVQRRAGGKFGLSFITENKGVQSSPDLYDTQEAAQSALDGFVRDIS